jgi:hypothetical protein
VQCRRDRRVATAGRDQSRAAGPGPAGAHLRDAADAAPGAAIGGHPRGAGARQRAPPRRRPGRGQLRWLERGTGRPQPAHGRPWLAQRAVRDRLRQPGRGGGQPRWRSRALAARWPAWVPRLPIS